jgi:TonB family protein
MVVAPYFRRYDLPWAAADEVEQRYRRLIRTLLIVTSLLALLIWLLPERERPLAKPTDLPERVVQLIVERPKPPPPPTPEKKPEEPKPEPKPQVARVERTPDKPRPQVKDQGLLAMKDELAELRDQLDPNQLASPELKTPGPDSRSERSLITSKVGAASGGINTSTLSRGFGGGAGSIGTHTTTSVAVDRSRVGGDGRGVQRGGSGKNSRPREEVEIVFDRNKGALYALYGRALRDAPELKGKLVLEFTIAPTGEITMCRVVSSELNDSELERKIVARVRLIRFQSMDVAPLTVTKPIDFFPA